MASDSRSNTSASASFTRLFKNPVLEAFTHVHPSVPFILWIPILAYLMFINQRSGIPVVLTLGMVAFGLFFWTLTEYVMHRYVFHFKATTRAGKYLVFLFHGIHHDEPQDPTRLVMPPVVSIVLGTAFYFLFKLVFGEPRVIPFYVGFMTGYLVYDYIHFAVHHFTPKTAWGRTIKENHMKHHFIKKQGKWGVSSPIWDHVFSTFKQ
jgi:sterol desaturase/sphingolipid hydroxylase (fatty acid hydroxylase superfamily)